MGSLAGTNYVSISMVNRWTANGVLLLAGAIWGMGFVAQSTGMEHLGPYAFIACRFTIAALVTWPFVFWEVRQATLPMHNKLGNMARFALIGVVFFFGMASQQVGLLTTSVSNSGFLTALYVVFTPLVAVVLFRDWPHRIVWPASLVALSGIYFLSGGDLSAVATGDFLTILSALFWALQVVLIGRFVSGSGRAFLLAATQFSVVALCAWLVVFTIGEPLLWENVWGARWELLFTGVFAGAIAFTLQVIGQRYTSASQAAIFLSSEAPFAAIFGAVILYERIGLIGVVGCLLILLAMFMVELLPAWQRRRSGSVS